MLNKSVLLLLLFLLLSLLLLLSSSLLSQIAEDPPIPHSELLDVPLFDPGKSFYFYHRMQGTYPITYLLCIIQDENIRIGNQSLEPKRVVYYDGSFLE